MKPILAKSLAGHDKGRIYVVLGEDGNDFILSDGSHKLIDHPKRKRQKHIQLIKHLSNEINEKAKEFERWDDSSIRFILNMYRREEGNCQKQM